MNDFGKCLDYAKLIMFADDCVVHICYACMYSIYQLHKKVQDI